jgi:small-conductance mechanosensitive channel
MVIAYPFLPGSDSPAFKGVSVFLGLLVTLGSAGVVGHMMSGLVLVYSRALKKGDYVRVGDVEGIVVEVGPLSTKIANRKDEEFTIPNTVMVGTTIKNFSRLAGPSGSPLTTKVTIGYDAPWRVVHDMLKTAAARTWPAQGPALRVAGRPVGLLREHQLVTRLEDPSQRIRHVRAPPEHQDAFKTRRADHVAPSSPSPTGGGGPQVKWQPRPVSRSDPVPRSA